MTFGFIPELVGRIPVLVALEELDTAAFVRILQEPRNALVKQYRKILSMEGVDLEFTKDALKRIAELAVQKKTGARGLRGYTLPAGIENSLISDKSNLYGPSACTRST